MTDLMTRSVAASLAEDVAESLAALAEGAPDDSETRSAAVSALAVLGRMHAAGWSFGDAQAWGDGRDGVGDGEIPPAGADSSPLSPSAARADLASLLARLPGAWGASWETLLPVYAATVGRAFPGATEWPALRAEVDGRRAAHLAAYLAASVRDGVRFTVHQTATRFCAVLRRQADVLAPLLIAPDTAIAGVSPFKDGGTTTVARVRVDGRELLLKRYNIKSLRHALGRAWRPSRAWHSWREGLRLQFLGIATPAPLALIEERFGPLRRRAWLISDFCPGPNLLSHLAADREPPVEEARAILRLFAALHRLRISHGDLKATNLLWHAGQVVVIDLDAVVQHRSVVAHTRAWRRDRARLLRNWPTGSVLQRWLDANLPAA